MRLPTHHALTADLFACVSDCIVPCGRKEAAEEQPCIYPRADLSPYCVDYIGEADACPDCGGTGQGAPHSCGGACYDSGCIVGGAFDDCPACHGEGVAG